MIKNFRYSRTASPITKAASTNKLIGLGIVGLYLFATTNAHADVLRIDQTAFTPAAGLITFSEFADGTQNPSYAAATYGGGVSAPAVTFGGWFVGQSAGTAADCPSGAAVSGCVLGLPTGSTLALDATSPQTFISGDASNPSSPVLSGSPQFNGPISILFSQDVAGVGLEGGYFNAVGGTAIRAFDRNGNVIGSVANQGLGIEFLGLVTADGQSKIAGLQFSLVGDEPFGFAIDNLRFGKTGQVIVPTVPVPATAWLFGSGLMGLAGFSRQKKTKI